MASQDTFERYRPLLFSIAYKMTGSVAASHHILNQTLERWLPVDAKHVDQPRLYLVKAVTNRSIIYQRDAEIERDQYPGIWLPEPLPMDHAQPEEQPGWQSFIGYLRLLELLSARDRAIYLLRENLDLGYEEIAEIIGRPEAYCRKQWERAREMMTAGGDFSSFQPLRHAQLMQAFERATARGQLDRLIGCLHEAVSLCIDGGEEVAPVTQALHGRDAAWEYFQDLYRKAASQGQLRFSPVNGCPALFIHDPEDQLPETVLVFEATGRAVDTIYAIRNPEKLAHLPLSGI